MGKAILMGCRLYSGAVSLGGQTNRVELPVSLDAKDVTTFGSYDAATDSIWREYIAGHKSGQMSASGFWETGVGSLDEDQFARLGAAGPWSTVPGRTAEIGDTAYLVNAVGTSYGLFGATGDVAPYRAEAASTSPVVRGAVLNPPGTARTATGSGTAFQLGAVSASQRVYAALHVLSVAGTSSPTVTVKVQSDTVGFPSATDRISFTAATAVGSQFSSAAGAITDDYWRVSYTISGTDPSFLFLVTAGVI